jgi:curved DNA-binding protein
MSRVDFYEVLGVPPSATSQEILRAYRRLVRRFHPDVNTNAGADEEFREIQRAYDVLSDPVARARYDASRAGARRQGASPRTAGAQRVWLGGPYFSNAFGDADSAADPWNSVFLGSRPAVPGSRAGPRQHPRAGADQETQLTITVEQAYRGAHLPIKVPGPAGDRTVRVRVPAGAVDGQRLVVRGCGQAGVGGAPSGDLHVTVRVAPHPRYRLEGHDVHVDLSVSPWEAALGATVPVATPSGAFRVRVPPGSSTGRCLRVPELGLPGGNDTAGDLYVHVRVHVPPILTTEERRLFTELADASTFDPRAPVGPRRDARRSPSAG